MNKEGISNLISSLKENRDWDIKRECMKNIRYIKLNFPKIFFNFFWMHEAIKSTKTILIIHCRHLVLMTKNIDCIGPCETGYEQTTPQLIFFINHSGHLSPNQSLHLKTSLNIKYDDSLTAHFVHLIPVTLLSSKICNFGACSDFDGHFNKDQQGEQCQIKNSVFESGLCWC